MELKLVQLMLGLKYFRGDQQLEQFRKKTLSLYLFKIILMCFYYFPKKRISTLYACV